MTRRTNDHDLLSSLLEPVRRRANDGPIPMRAIDRFMRHVELIAGVDCHIWTGAYQRDRGDRGYGWFNVTVFGLDVKHHAMLFAHRAAFTFANGHPPRNNVLHSCDTPLCVNPAHLRDGTQAENMQQAVSRKRQVSGYGLAARRRAEAARRSA